MQIDIFELLEPKQENERWVKKGDNQWFERKCHCCGIFIGVGVGSVYTIENKAIHTTCMHQLPIEQIQRPFRHLWKGGN